MNVAKNISTAIGWILVALWVIWSIFYWTDIYDGIGLFGSILTIPFSTILATILSLFADFWTSLIVFSMWGGAIILFLSLGNQD